ncbi:hypothetical protein M7I_0546 [Glarea lozoyensis 74030]|uniref:Uncharacterized protein n=1 Tax=Glarea lozoyensis (strain ATCC 74030 / MF5533) TaxID=1104152 RepID=H0EDT9_GLAL7|nr:hypothetical protein M7I_0546 [Glarea lozoyensis 74030]
MAKFSLIVAALSVLSVIKAAPLQERQSNTTIVSESAPNPIGTLYPTGITGTLNGTIVVVPIPYTLARSLIPEKFGILKEAYQSILPALPKDQYPTVHVSYPFVDLLGDGYSSFSFQEYLIISADNPFTIGGVAAYKTIPVPATFRPNGQAYAFTPNGKRGEIYYDAYAANASSNDPPIVTTKFTPQGHLRWPMELFVNVTNQPAFTDGDVGCDNQIMMFNTTLSTGMNRPVPIVGDITIKAPFFQKDRDSQYLGVAGIKVDVAFLENNLVLCKSMKGYHGTGSGDRGTGIPTRTHY